MSDILLTNLKKDTPLVREEVNGQQIIVPTDTGSCNQGNDSIGNGVSFSSSKEYPGDKIETIEPLRVEGWQKLDFPDPALFLCFYHKDIAEGHVTLHDWQTEFHEFCAGQKATSQEPLKYCLATCNGSGKDAFIIAGWSAWFCACKIRSRVIITSSSGVQLTAQTENYIRSLCQKV